MSLRIFHLTALDVLDRVRGGEAVQLARYPDGFWEMALGRNEKGDPVQQDCDGNEYTPELRRRLVSTFLSIPAPGLVRCTINRAEQKRWKRLEGRTSPNQWASKRGLQMRVFADCRLFRDGAMQGMEEGGADHWAEAIELGEVPNLHLVGPEYLRNLPGGYTHHVTADRDMDDREVMRRLVRELTREKKATVLFVASKWAPLMVEQLAWLFPEHSLIDFGAALDHHCGRTERKYQR